MCIGGAVTSELPSATLRIFAREYNVEPCVAEYIQKSRKRYCVKNFHSTFFATQIILIPNGK